MWESRQLRPGTVHLPGGGHCRIRHPGPHSIERSSGRPDPGRRSGVEPRRWRGSNLRQSNDTDQRRPRRRSLAERGRHIRDAFPGSSACPRLLHGARVPALRGTGPDRDDADARDRGNRAPADSGTSSVYRTSDPDRRWSVGSRDPCAPAHTASGGKAADHDGRQ